jgi:hypothetical protein
VNPLVDEVVDSSSEYPSPVDAKPGQAKVLVSETVVFDTTGVFSTGAVNAVGVTAVAVFDGADIPAPFRARTR